MMASVVQPGAQLRHGLPVSHEGWLLKEGANGALFRRYMRLSGSALSNSHSDHHSSAFVAGRRPRELVVHLPKRKLSYFAETRDEFLAWEAAADRAAKRDLYRYYKIGDMLGEGAFAKVYLGSDTETGEQFAIKIVQKARNDPKEMEFIYAR
jgi:serine/threonine protein kinase